MDKNDEYELLLKVSASLEEIPKDMRSQNWSAFYSELQIKIYDLMDELQITGNDLY